MTRAEPSTALSARHLIGGEWLDQGTGGAYDHVDPATGLVQATVPLAGAADVDAAVVAARAALPGWRAVAPAERRDVLFRLSLLLRESADELAEMAGRENGTPSTMAPMAASGLPADWFAYYAGWTEKIAGETIAPSTGNGLDYTVPEPYGVIAVIIPWNAPLVSLGMKVAPALAAGNCVVVKPSELAPFTPARFGELCARAGLPAGVVNIVAGGQEAGDALVRHPGVDKITFTGGLATARRIMAAAAANVTPLVFELGGKSANVIFSDAPLGVAIPTAVMSALAMSGQGCALPTRLLVQESVYADAVDQIVSMAQAIPVGHAGRPRHRHGPGGERRPLHPHRGGHRPGRSGLGGKAGRRRQAPRRRPGRRLLHPADRLRRRRPGQPARPGGDLRTGARRPALPHGGRRRAPWPTAPPTAWRHISGRATSPGPTSWPGGSRRVPSRSTAVSRRWCPMCPSAACGAAASGGKAARRVSASSSGRRTSC